MEEEKTKYQIEGGNNQFAPNATKMEQNFYGDQFVPPSLRANKTKSLTLLVLGAGADASLGLPTSASLMPRIVEYLETEEGQEVDATLRKAIPIPSFLPPLKLQTVISKNYIDVWYQTKQAILNADKIVVLGCSFTTPDSFFCDILRENRDAKIVMIDKNIEAVALNVCRILQLPGNRYTKQMVDGHEHRTYNNRVTFVQADLAEVDLTQIC